MAEEREVIEILDADGQVVAHGIVSGNSVEIIDNADRGAPKSPEDMSKTDAAEAAEALRQLRAHLQDAAEALTRNEPALRQLRAVTRR